MPQPRSRRRSRPPSEAHCGTAGDLAVGSFHPGTFDDIFCLMASEPEEIFLNALALSARERARLARELLASLDDGEDRGASDAWRIEIEARVREIEDGDVETEAWSAVRKRLSHRWRRS